MNRSGEAPHGAWLEIDITQAGEDLTAIARGSQNEQTRPYPLGPALTLEVARRFGEWMKKAALNGTPLASTIPAAQALHSALFRDELQKILLQTQGAASGEPILLRLMIHAPELQSIPWEVLCPTGKDDFLGISQDLCIARGVHSTRPWQPREVRGAVRLLVISPSDEEAPNRLFSILSPQINSGEIEWLPPLTGRHAHIVHVLQRLRCEPIPNILHFIGHGDVSPEQGPRLRLADQEDQESWLKIRLLAKELEAAFRGDLRLVVLEACQGAQPDTLSSAAELLAEAGADAVVAHLWPVKSDVARVCSAAFYRSLTGAAEQRGDVARSLHAARRTILGAFMDSAEAFSPVLYLRGRDSTLFDFKNRKLKPPSVSSPRGQLVATTDPALQALLDMLQRPFSLILGDQWSNTLEDFRENLHEKLRGTPWAAPETLPMSALAQRYALRFGDEALGDRFRTLFRDAMPSLPLVQALARRIKPGVHITLLRVPVLEDALATHQPHLPLYVIQPARPPDRSVLVQKHVAGKGWVPIEKLPDSFDPDREAAIVRLYRGFLPDRGFGSPLLTEDDYLLRIRDLDFVLPTELADSILGGSLYRRPTLLLGMSLLMWDHRMLLHRIFSEQSLPKRSMVILEPGDAARDAWQLGQGLPGGRGIQTVQGAHADLATFLGHSPPGQPL
jgi:hypothetical protein